MSSKPSKGQDKTLRVVINDASCLIDLRKVKLCLTMLRLPYRFVVPLPVKENELLDFTALEWKELQAAGLEVVDLDSAQVGRSFEFRTAFGTLSAEDCFSLSLAESLEHSMLLTSDASLRKVAVSLKVNVHGVLWVIDELHRLQLAPPQQLAKCLTTWRDDPLVWLPAALIAARLRMLGK
jgi:predicted nucleic acid-binding protein